MNVSSVKLCAEIIFFFVLPVMGACMTLSTYKYNILTIPQESSRFLTLHAAVGIMASRWKYEDCDVTEEDALYYGK